MNDLLLPKLSVSTGLEVQSKTETVDTNLSFKEQIWKSQILIDFLTFTGVLWRNKNDMPNSLLRLLCSAWFAWLRIVFLPSLGFSIYSLYAYHRSLTFTTVFVCWTAQLAVMLPAIWRMSTIIHQPTVLIVDVEVCRSAVVLCLVYYFVMIVNQILWLLIAYSYFDICDLTCWSTRSIEAVASLAQIGFLSATLFFIIVEARTAAMAVSLLATEAQQQTLTLRQFHATRKQIKEISSSSMIPNGMIMFVAFINCLGCIVWIAFYKDKDYPAAGSAIVESLYTFTLFPKEIALFVIAFLEIASVNESSDQLVNILETTEWSSADLELTRLKLAAASHGNRLGFPLMGYHVTRRDALLQISGFVIAGLTAVVRSVVTNTR